MTVQFFMQMQPPSATHQMKKIRVVNGHPQIYEPRAVAEARAQLTAHLAYHVPVEPMKGPIRLIVKWCFPAGKHPSPSWRITPPDTDNLQKLLKDCMTDCGFWKDDAQVCSEYTDKMWMEPCGIFIHAEEIGNG